jgi:FKBP-type peptidyl-prolyl cis-trans isomerase 2
MGTIASGDRVQVLCASRSEDGTLLGSDKTRDTPYWIRTGRADSKLGAVCDALIGMDVGQRKTFTTGPDNGGGSRVLIHELEVVEIRKAAITGATKSRKP